MKNMRGDLQENNQKLNVKDTSQNTPKPPAPRSQKTPPRNNEYDDCIVVTSPDKKLLRGLDKHGYDWEYVDVVNDNNGEVVDNKNKPRKDPAGKPIISYYGGKQRMASKIVALLPPHTVYVEPFAGGAAVLFKKGLPSNLTNIGNYKEVINDTSELLINMYRVMQDREKREILLEMLKYTPHSHSEYRRARVIEDNKERRTDIELAWAYYILIQCSFAKKYRGGWSFSVKDQNNAITFRRKVHGLSAILDRFENVFVENIDAIECIKKWDSPQTCFYCDPPYVGANQGHYSGYTADDFDRLVEALDKCQGSFLLSSYDVGQNIPNHWERYEFATYACSDGSNRTRAGKRTTKKTADDYKRTEVLWRMDRHHNARAELLKIMEGQVW